MSHEACILDSTSLEVVRVWGGHLDWVYCTSLPGDGNRHDNSHRRFNGNAAISNRIEPGVTFFFFFFFPWQRVDQHQSRILSVSADCKLSLWIFDTSSLAVVKSKVFEICSKSKDIPICLIACSFDPTWAALVMRSCIQVKKKQESRSAQTIISLFHY